MGTVNKYQALVIESENSLVQRFAEFFQRLEFSPVSFSSIQTTLDHIDEYSPRLIVLEWTGSTEACCQFIKQIKSRKDGSFISIIMISRSATILDLQQIVAAGLDSFWVDEIDKDQWALWLSSVEQKILEAMKREAKSKEVEQYKKEQEDFNEQLEEAISRANQMTRETEQAYIEINQIFKTIAGGIVVIDSNCKLLRCNDTFLEIVGKSREEAMDLKCNETFHNVLCGSADCPVKVIKRGLKRVENDIEYTLPEGRRAYFHVISTPFHGAVGEFIGVVEHIIDITARVEAEKALKESEKRYKELSTIDELTQLFNKRYFGSHFKLEVERSRRYGHPLSLLLMDIDNFKHHNDTYGHADGDKVLAQLGAVISNSIRINDLGCRYGGEEFTVILPETTGENAIVVAERIRKSFAAIEFQPNPDEVVHKTVSVGIAELVSGEDSMAFLERTDQNMYKAKNSGKNRYVFE